MRTRNEISGAYSITSATYRRGPAEKCQRDRASWRRGSHSGPNFDGRQRYSEHGKHTQHQNCGDGPLSFRHQSVELHEEGTGQAEYKRVRVERCLQWFETRTHIHVGQNGNHRIRRDEAPYRRLCCQAEIQLSVISRTQPYLTGRWNPE